MFMEQVSDPNVLVMGVNPGPTRTAIGKSILGIHLALLMLTLFGGEGFLLEALIALAIGYGVTSGQQYVLDGPANVLKKCNLIFLRPTDWKELGQISNIQMASRRKSESEDGEAMNSWIDFHFKDGTTHIWSLYYGDSENYVTRINSFLARFNEKEEITTPSTASVNVELTDTTPTQPVTDSTTIWEKPSQSTPNESASTGFWDAYQSEDKTHQ